MGATFPAVMLEAEVGFVDELGGLEAWLAGRAAEMDGGDFMKFAVNFVGLRWGRGSNERGTAAGKCQRQS